MAHISWLPEARSWLESERARIKRLGIDAFERDRPDEALRAAEGLRALLQFERTLLELEKLPIYDVPERVPLAAPQDASLAEPPLPSSPSAEPSSTRNGAAVQAPAEPALSTPETASPADVARGEAASAPSGPVETTSLADAISDRAPTAREPSSAEEAPPEEPVFAEAPPPPEASTPPPPVTPAAPAAVSPDAQAPADNAPPETVPAPPAEPVGLSYHAVVERTLSPSKPPSRAHIRDLLRRAAEFEESHTWSVDQWQEVKALVCAIRAALKRLGADSPERDVVIDELRIIRKLYSERVEPQTFFGFNEIRSLDPEIWDLFEEAYRNLADAFRAMKWLEGKGSSRSPEHKMLAHAAAAAEAFVYRLIHKHTVGVEDQHQLDLHGRLEEWLDHTPLSAWVSEGPYAWTLEQVRQEAGRVEEKLRELLSKELKQRQGEEAFAKLEALLRDEEDDPDFPNRLVRATYEALEAGIPPSNKKLRELLADFRGVLEDLDHPQADSLRKGLASLAASAPPEEEPESESEAAPDDVIDPEVVKYTRGKRLLLVGGNKGQAERRERYKKAFEFAEVEWPDLEPDSDPDEALHLVPNADLIAYLVRFSRHGFRSLSDEGKKLGKDVVVLKAGLHPRQLAYAIRTQILDRRAAPSPAAV